MSLPPQKFREIVFQLLYSHDLSSPSEDEMLPLIMKENAVTRKAVKIAYEKVYKILEKKGEIDELISSTSKSYALNRIQSVEKNILRLAVYELLFEGSSPMKITITEAMRLARKFGNPSSENFVNAILDAIFKQSKGQKIDELNIERSIEAFLEEEKVAAEAALQSKDLKENHVSTK